MSTQRLPVQKLLTQRLLVRSRCSRRGVVRYTTPLRCAYDYYCRHLQRHSGRAPKGCWSGRVALAEECLAGALAARRAIDEATRQAARVGLSLVVGVRLDGWFELCWYVGVGADRSSAVGGLLLVSSSRSRCVSRLSRSMWTSHLSGVGLLLRGAVVYRGVLLGRFC